MTKNHSALSRNALLQANPFARVKTCIANAWSSGHLVIWSSLIALTGCGFEPIAGTTTKAYDESQLPKALANITVVTSTNAHQRLTGEQFRIALEDLLNPGEHQPSMSEYRLEVSLAPTANPGLIAPDGKAQRYLVSLNSNFRLYRVSDGQLIERGTLNRNGSYSNLPNSYFSTYIAEQDTLKRLNAELAEQYRMKLASLLSSPPKEPSVLPNVTTGYSIYDPSKSIDPENGVAVPFNQP